MVLSKITPSPSLTSFVHSRLPWASRHHALLTRSVLAVSHDLDGLLRWLDCGLVASHFRSWGSHTFTLSRFPYAFCFPFKAFPAHLALTRHLSALVLTPPHSVTRARCPLAVSHLPRFRSVPTHRCQCEGSTLSSNRGLNLKALIQTNSTFSSNCVAADRGVVSLLGFLLRQPAQKD